MWFAILGTILLFYLFTILQSSFLVHFNLFGASPNLVFILFFILIFFEKKNSYYPLIFYAISAGLFLDFFSYTYFGVSIALLLLVGFLVKKTQTLLQEKRDNRFPFIYFLPLFFISLLVYDLILKRPGFDWRFAAEIVYNLLVACIAFYVCKKFFKFGFDDRQLKLFNK